jgi:hypothetical protein
MSQFEELEKQVKSGELTPKNLKKLLKDEVINKLEYEKLIKISYNVEKLESYKDFEELASSRLNDEIENPTIKTKGVKKQSNSGVYENDLLSVKQWLITFLILSIPVVNLIMIFVYAFSPNEPLARKNWAQASLVVSLIALVIFILIF